MSQRNLIDIMKIEQTYFKNIELVNKGEKIMQISDDGSSKKNHNILHMPYPLSNNDDSSIATEEESIHDHRNAKKNL